MECTGGCHCGNLQVKLRLSKEPEQMAIRACTCSFCRAHAPRFISDPAGSFEISAADWTTVQYYRFGTRTCDFLLCGRCGVFIAAVTDADAPSPRAVVNVNCLAERARFSDVPVLHDFDGETAGARQARHNANWMPVIVRREAETA
jgi:hypothetical protein